MSDAMQIRTVTVELLRPGPAHNQLLSPLTQYLGMCDDAEAGIVTLPYEHAAFLRRMKSMRYVSAEDSDRLPVLREMGIEMAKVLGAIPRLPGSLAGGAGGPDTLVHLRLVLSAAELASLPFELAKVPIGPGAWAEGLLSLQARMPVVITRRTRNVSTNGVQWPSRPRILFIAADPSEVPFEEHRRELIEALQPFLYPGRDNPVLSADGRREQFGNILTIIKNARFNDVAAECAANRYTHIHILAHGDKDPEAEDTSYALVLHTDDNEPDVISGERFASAFTCLVGDAIQRPAVVTLASCDSGNDGSVIIPGGSIAHVLHQAGIPLVIASQFPLSKEGSTLVVRELYRGLLWGESPWILLHRIRTALHGRLTAHSHDWASLVVYEALPANLDEQLEEARYSQGKLAIDAALERIDRAVLDSGAALDGMLFKQLTQAVVDAGRKLPMEGRFAMECLGLLGSSQKRLALAEFNIALAGRARCASPACVGKLRPSRPGAAKLRASSDRLSGQSGASGAAHVIAALGAGATALRCGGAGQAGARRHLGDCQAVRRVLPRSARSGRAGLGPRQPGRTVVVKADRFDAGRSGPRRRRAPGLRACHGVNEAVPLGRRVCDPVYAQAVRALCGLVGASAVRAGHRGRTGGAIVLERLRGCSRRRRARRNYGKARRKAAGRRGREYFYGN